jgi:hypothetical protein
MKVSGKLGNAKVLPVHPIEKTDRGPRSVLSNGADATHNEKRNGKNLVGGPPAQHILGHSTTNQHIADQPARGVSGAKGPDSGKVAEDGTCE